MSKSRFNRKKHWVMELPPASVRVPGRTRQFVAPLNLNAKRVVAKNFDEQCTAKRRGRRCQFVEGHRKEYRHEDYLGKTW